MYFSGTEPKTGNRKKLPAAQGVLMVDKKKIDDWAWNSSQNQLTANKYFPEDRMSGSVA